MEAPASQSTILSKCMQGGLLIAMPATIIAKGGLQAIWQDRHWTVRTAEVAILLPSAVCSLALAEDAIRAINLFVKDILSGRDYRKDEQLSCEIKRVAGFARAVVFPINGWGVLVKLPVNDHYVYAVPVRIGTKLGDLALRGAINILKLMDKAGIFKLIEILYKITLRPVFKVVKVVVVTAGSIIASTLGFARDLIFKS